MQKIKYLLNDIESIFQNKKVAKLVKNLVSGDRLIDLLFHLPSNINSKKFNPPLHQINSKDDIVTKVKVESHVKPIRKSQPFKVITSNNSGSLTLTFFKVFPNYIQRYFSLNKEVIVSGKVEKYNSQLTMAHPQLITSEKFNQENAFEVIYPLTAGIKSHFLRQKIIQTLANIDEIDEIIDQNLIAKNKWPSFTQALNIIHNPKNLGDLEPNNIARQRLAYDELLAARFAWHYSKSKTAKNIGICQKNHQLVEKLQQNLPFTLTDGQKKVFTQISADMASNKKMFRLLQGDVGSGKTIIAILAMVISIADKKQAAIIVPISLLANQHFNNFNKILQNLDINIAILTSKTTAKKRKNILNDLASGEINIIIGTHALIVDDVIFKDLGLIVIDEQHRFGVIQRLKLVQKGNDADILLMSATPIPRSLVMSIYGDMEVSILDQKPQNRQAITTIMVSDQKIDQIISGVKRAVAVKEKIYWICPLIQQSENLDFSAAVDRKAYFDNIFDPSKVGIIHGQLKKDQKDKIMEEFAKNDSKIQILIATTVIEVGVDVPDASHIIIENAQKFGLAQLHQLRGRVGRGPKKSYCTLIYNSKQTSQTGIERLRIMRDSDDGFYIAQADLKMRGAGQIFGTRQSGFNNYKIADLNYDYDLLQIANKQVDFILEDENLNKNNLEKIKRLLYIFGYDQCLKLIKSG